MTQPSVALALAGIAFILTVIWGSPLIRILRILKMGDSIRLELPDSYQAKAGKPTMGGVMVILPVLLLTGLLNAVSLIGFSGQGLSVLVPLGTMVAFGALGAVDDWEKLRNRARGEGMKARYKFLLQVVLAAVVAWGLYAYLDVPHMFVPGVQREISLGWFYIFVAMFMIVGSANAVNFTDGLDGMAGLITATCFAVYGLIALIQGQVFLAQFCFTVVGALFGFLWFNVHPSMLIMGDTGAMALGSTLGVVALMSGHWILYPIIAIIPTIQTLSIVLQVSYFKLTKGKRIFKMSPIHLHFELSGWSETQVVQRFWLITLLAAMIGVALAVT
ncbi:MAG: phospho-N-acetylmuramoyl-pentapeptide-transferase [Anaerolineae bacterium]|nr:MAG: phospho-N-acetylmuramoyl-pentapeptide-transferase [Anaerolineae bacterium]